MCINATWSKHRALDGGKEALKCLLPTHASHINHISVFLISDAELSTDIVNKQITMKTEEKNSNVPKVRIAVLGQMNVGKSGRWIILKVKLTTKKIAKRLEDEKLDTFLNWWYLPLSTYFSLVIKNIPADQVLMRVLLQFQKALKFYKSTIFTTQLIHGFTKEGFFNLPSIRLVILKSLFNRQTRKQTFYTQHAVRAWSVLESRLEFP